MARELPSLPAMFFAQAATARAPPFLWTKRGRRLGAVLMAKTAAVRRVAGGLLSLGIAPGDRVVLVSENRPEWIIADLAIMAHRRDHRAGLHHQHRGRPPPYPDQ